MTLNKRLVSSSFPDVVLRQSGSRRARRGHVAQLRQLHLLLEGAGIFELMQHARHPPREVLGAPNALEHRFRIGSQGVLLAFAIETLEPISKNLHIVDGQVHALRASWRDNVRGIAGKEEATMLHNTGDKAPHSNDVLLEDSPFSELPTVSLIHSGMHLMPNAVVGPVVNAVLGVALKVHALHRWRTRAD